MKFGLITDTHNKSALVKKAITLFEEQGCEAVFHAGDFESDRIVRSFQNRPFAFHFVTDHNSHDRRMRHRCDALDVTVGGVRVAMVHDTYQPVIVDGREFGVKQNILDGRYDLVIYGHLHYFNLKQSSRSSRTVAINSGGLYFPELSTVAIFDTEARGVTMYSWFEKTFEATLRFPCEGKMDVVDVLHEAAACTFADALSRLRWKSKDRWEHVFSDLDNDQWFSKNYKILFARLGIDDHPAFFY